MSVFFWVNKITLTCDPNISARTYFSRTWYHFTSSRFSNTSHESSCRNGKEKPLGLSYCRLILWWSGRKPLKVLENRSPEYIPHPNIFCVPLTSKLLRIRIKMYEKLICLLKNVIFTKTSAHFCFFIASAFNLQLLLQRFLYSFRRFSSKRHIFCSAGCVSRTDSTKFLIRRKHIATFLSTTRVEFICDLQQSTKFNSI